MKVFHNIISSGLKSERNFLELVRCIYSKGTFSKDLFLNAAISWIRKNIFSQNVKNVLSSIAHSGKLAFSSYIFLSLLGVVGKGGEVVEKGSFFERYEKFFDTAWKKAVFLTGVLTGYILDFQQREKGSAPFLKKLKGLKMRKEDVEGLLPEIKSKLMQYKIESERTNRELERASKYFLEAGDWNATVDEINFVFTIGMSMYRRFIRGEDDDSEKQE
ncbi:MAG: type I-B CRISPR-associated protein Cas8b/Csh1 [Thermotogaceae bacterium]|nr:type I-B CRISPR-associated protein Cas8b/Csh1 [Thermotogaceae bacterium]